MNRMRNGMGLGLAALLFATSCQSPEAKWAKDLRAFAAEDAVQPPRPGGTLFVGSSSFRRWKELASAFPERHVINRGFGGSQMHELLALSDRLVWPYAPREIVVYEGDNDIAAGKTPEQFFREFQTFVREVHWRLPEARIYFVSIKPSPKREALWPRAARANQLVREYAARDPRLTFIDVATPMLDGAGRPRRELFVEDELHLNADGYALWAEIIGRALNGP